MRRAVTGGAWWLSSRAAGVAAIAPAVVTIFICAHQLTLHGVLHAVVLHGEAPNLGSSIALSRGALPYSNFPLAQPPGMTVLLLPLAWLSHFVALSIVVPIARALTAIATVISVYLAGYAARPYGIPASLLAGVFTATYSLAFYSTAGVTVGPWILLFTLIGITLAFREGSVSTGTRVLFAGIFLGFACTMKPWAAVPALVFLGCGAASVHEKRDKLLPAAGGVALGIVVPCLIFFMAAPGAFWRDVVLAELPGHGSASAGIKLAQVLGLTGAAAMAHPTGLAITVTVILIAVVLVTAVAGYPTSLPYDWFVTFVAVAVLLAVLLPGAMSLQYGEFALPLIAITVAMTAGRLLALVAASWSGRPGDPRSSIAAGIGVLMAVGAIVVAAVAAPADGAFAVKYANRHAIVANRAIAKAIPPGSCAISDNATLLMVANRFIENGSSCPVVVDPAGVLAIARADRHAGSTIDEWEQWMTTAKNVVFANPPDAVPLGKRLRTFFHQNYAVAATRGRVTIYVKTVG